MMGPRPDAPTVSVTAITIYGKDHMHTSLT